LDRWNCWNAAWSVSTTSAITQARKRLGRHVFAELFERTRGPVAGKPGPTAEVTALGTARGAFLRRWRPLAIDGFDIDLPDSKENAAEFGYAGSGANRSAFPKARVVALAECGTHAFVAAEVDAYSVGEKTLAARLLPRLRDDELLTADRGFYSWQAWRSIRRIADVQPGSTVNCTGLPTVLCSRWSTSARQPTGKGYALLRCSCWPCPPGQQGRGTVLMGPDEQLQRRIWARHSVKPMVACGRRIRSEISTAGEESSTGERQTTGRGVESLGARRDLDHRGSLHTAEDEEGNAVPAHQPGNRTAVLQDRQAQPLEA
jgi:hypothetical protein